MTGIIFLDEHDKEIQTGINMGLSYMNVAIEIPKKEKENDFEGNYLMVVPLNTKTNLQRDIFYIISRSTKLMLVNWEKEDEVGSDGDYEWGIDVKRIKPIFEIRRDSPFLSDAYILMKNSPSFAFYFAYVIDRQKPFGDTRRFASQDSVYAYQFALLIDKKPHKVTRDGACESPDYAYLYARHIDKKITLQTIRAFWKSPVYKMYYLRSGPKVLKPLRYVMGWLSTCL